jgi:hypothetical protein
MIFRRSLAVFAAVAAFSRSTTSAFDSLCASFSRKASFKRSNSSLVILAFFPSCCLFPTTEVLANYVD